MQAFLEEFAKERGLATKKDAAGNTVICCPGSGGGEQAPPVVIQGHIGEGYAQQLKSMKVLISLIKTSFY